MLSWLFSGTSVSSKEDVEQQDDAWELVGPTYASALKSTNLKTPPETSKIEHADLRRKTLELAANQKYTDEDEQESENSEAEEDFTDAIRRKLDAEAMENEALNAMGNDQKPFATKAYVSRKTRRRLKKEKQAAKKDKSS